MNIKNIYVNNYIPSQKKSHKLSKIKTILWGYLSNSTYVEHNKTIIKLKYYIIVHCRMLDELRS